MTQQEILAYYARIKAERKLQPQSKAEKKVKKAEVKIEEKPAEEEKEEIKVEFAEEENPAPKKGKKPANREYMVVEDIPEEK